VSDFITTRGAAHTRVGFRQLESPRAQDAFANMVEMGRGGGASRRQNDFIAAEARYWTIAARTFADSLLKACDV